MPKMCPCRRNEHFFSPIFDCFLHANSPRETVVTLGSNHHSRTIWLKVYHSLLFALISCCGSVLSAIYLTDKQFRSHRCVSLRALVSTSFGPFCMLTSNFNWKFNTHTSRCGLFVLNLDEVRWISFPFFAQRSFPSLEKVDNMQDGRPRLAFSPIKRVWNQSIIK